MMRSRTKKYNFKSNILFATGGKLLGNIVILHSKLVVSFIYFLTNLSQLALASMVPSLLMARHQMSEVWPSMGRVESDLKSQASSLIASNVFKKKTKYE